MSYIDTIFQKTFQESMHLRQQVLADGNLLDQVRLAGQTLVNSLRSGSKVLLCGNGGSAADAQHIAAEMIVRYKSSHDRDPIPAIALTTDSSVLTAGANDYSFADVFYRQVIALGQPGDVLFAISTSGNSANVIRAMEAAQQKGMQVIKFLGGDGGKMIAMPGIPLLVPHKETARVQEIHITLGHILCDVVDAELFGFRDF